MLQDIGVAIQSLDFNWAYQAIKNIKVTFDLISSGLGMPFEVVLFYGTSLVILILLAIKRIAI